MSAARQSGFTLAEALVSLFIFALVAGGAVALLAQSLNAQRSVSEAQERLRSVQAARALLASDMAQIAFRIPREPNRLPAVFVGTGGAEPEMSFVRLVGERGARDGLATSQVFVSYAIDAAGRLMRETRTALDPGAASHSRSRALLEGAADIRFEFNDGGGWRQDWPMSTAGVPRAVAIIATLPRYGAIRLQAMTGL